MEVQYRKAFLKDLKRLKRQAVYYRVFDLAFTVLPEVHNLQEITNVKAMKGHPGRYRIRVGAYRIGIKVAENSIELMRVLHRKEFYRYFP
ncbi:MAG: type II toxin-antitoxin system RelE/ParE family toxin [Chloroflexi bacterium]|nr:type II toxin-antitoxin system RelE/ParE family toxin [Chloroflexota bacterium]